MQKTFENIFLNVLLVIIFGIFLFTSKASAASLQLTETNIGTIDHAVTIESPGQFRIIFEAADNWGLSQWYDLANDPSAQTNLTRDYSREPLPGQVGPWGPSATSVTLSEPGLFNQVFYPADPKAHMYSAKYFQPNNPRGFQIIENSPSRVIVENLYYPIIGSKIFSELEFHTRYSIYPDGKIYISNKFTAINDYYLSEWRNSVIGLGDPSFGFNSDSGTASSIDQVTKTITDTTKNWTENQWVGYMVEQPSYKNWLIVSNTSNTLQLSTKNTAAIDAGNYTIRSSQSKFGWLRGTNTQMPYSYTENSEKYIYEYWDPTTPAPFTDYTKASILLVPKAGNPFQGKQYMHSWGGFKRWYYSYSPLTLVKGQEFIQQYLMHLGTQGSAVLPDLSIKNNDDLVANDYLNPATLSMTMGLEKGFDKTEGIYVVEASNKKASFSMDGSVYRRIKPAFKVEKYDSSTVPIVSVDGQQKTIGNDFTASVLNGTSLLIQFSSDISTNANINIEPGTEDFVPENQSNMLYSISDFIVLVSNWMKPGTVSDLNNDAIVNAKDLGIIMSKWN